MANSFFNDSNKVYTENLNDGILVGNAFDWTVDVSLPTDTGGVFPDSSTIVMAKVADVYITPNSNLSIGSSIENSSGSSQVYRLTVYPNFNRFGGFKSITLDGDGTIYIANKGATTPIANNLDYDDLGNVPELKVLKEYDIVVTIPNNKSVTGLDFVFQSSSADVSGSINQSNVAGLGDRLTAIESKDTQQDGRLTDLEGADENIFNYNLMSDYYNVNIDGNILISCIVTDVNGERVEGKTLTLYHNSNSVGSETTSELGVATWSVTCDSWGLQDFRVANQSIQVNVTGFKRVLYNSTYALWVDESQHLAQLRCSRTNITITPGESFVYSDFTIPTKYRPASTVLSIIYRGNPEITNFVYTNGGVGIYNAGSTRTGWDLAFINEWHY